KGEERPRQSTVRSRSEEGRVATENASQSRARAEEGDRKDMRGVRDCPSTGERKTEEEEEEGEGGGGGERGGAENVCVPVIMDSSTVLVPRTISPSAGTLWPRTTCATVKRRG